MAFQPMNRTPKPKTDMVVGIGAHAFINWAPPDGTTRRGVPMIDGSGATIANDLCDGEEVEILSWRPRSREGLSYQVRRMRDGREWWIAAIYLRRLPSARGVGASSAAPTADKDGAR
jgi:hypothetical protein